MTFTPFTPTSAAPGGLFPLVPGSASAPTIINASIVSFFAALGKPGFYLDPNGVYDATGWVINGLTNFRFESRMTTSYEFNGVISRGAGYVITDTGAPADGIQIYSSNPSPSTGSPTAGVVFERIVFTGVGAGNSNAAVHLGGGERDVRFTECLFSNPATAAGSYAVINDTALSNNNAEAQVFTRCQFNGGYGGYGIGNADQTQRANDCEYYSCRFAGGTYGVNAFRGGGHNFYGAYERSSPTAASYNNQGATLHFWGGEHLVNTGTGVAHNVTAGTTVLHSVNVSQGAATNTVTVSGGTWMARGDCVIRGTLSVSGSGVLDLNDPTLSLAAATITGTSTSPALLAASYTRGGASAAPAFTAWTGTITYGPMAVQAASTPILTGFVLTNGTPNLITWTTPNDGQPHSVIVTGSVRVTTAETGGAIGIVATDPSGGALSPALDAGTHANGTFSFNARLLEVGPNTTVTVQQTSALTAGAAVAFAKIVGA